LVFKSDVSQSVEFLAENGWEPAQFRSSEIWRKGKWALVPIDNNTLVIGSEETEVKNIIRTVEGEQPSLYNDEQFRELMSRLPEDGLEIQYVEIPPIEDDPDLSSLVFMGRILTIENEQTLRMTLVATSPDENTDIENIFRRMVKEPQQDSEFYWDDTSISNDGAYWKFTAIGSAN
jgi:hypothetical protein